MADYPAGTAGIFQRASWGIREDGTRIDYMVWDVVVDGRTVGLWTTKRWARRDLRRELRKAKRHG